MTADARHPAPRDSLRLQSLLALVLIAVGLLLVAFMVVTEDEPGALPLLLVLLGIGWFALTRWRARRDARRRA